MSYQPKDSYRARQTAPLTQSLPRRTMREVTHGPSLPAGAAVPEPQAHQASELAQRYELLDRLGVPTAASEDFDELARDMATRAGFMYGFVNLFLEEQTFVGLHQPPADSGYVIVGRTMSHDSAGALRSWPARRPSRCTTCTPALASAATTWSTPSGSAPTSAHHSSTPAAPCWARSASSTPRSGP